MTRRHAHLAGIVASLAILAGAATPAQSDDPVPVQVLPDMRQELPSGVRIAQVNGTWRLGFASEVSNPGPGYLKITGNGPGNAPMVADQLLEMSDGTSTTVPGIGEMHYVIGGGHQHWHLLDFERYELRSAADSSNAVVKDQKTGFCLADAFTDDSCGRNQPELTTVSEGISVGGSDVYLGYLEGQYLLLDEQTTPAGDYLLVNRVNPTGGLLEKDDTNNAASLRLELMWSSTGTPSVTITNSCLATVDCPAPPDPLADPDPTPDPPAPAPAPGPIAPAPEPQPVPIVPPSQFAPATAKASMGRDMAGRLVRRAIQKSMKRTPRSLRASCRRSETEGFACNASWRGLKSTRWSGKVKVWYVVKNRELSWYYDLTAVRHPGGKRLAARSVKGSASRAVFAGPSGSLFCAVPR